MAIAHLSISERTSHVSIGLCPTLGSTVDLPITHGYSPVVQVTKSDASRELQRGGGSSFTSNRLEKAPREPVVGFEFELTARAVKARAAGDSPRILWESIGKRALSQTEDSARHATGTQNQLLFRVRQFDWYLS